jgi:flagellar protein FliO/FliZ
MDLDLYLRFFVALLLVLGLIGALTWAARRFGVGGRLVPNAGKHRRLTIVEVTALDTRRKLVLLRRDDTEHLLLLGTGQDLVVEAGIAAPPASPPVDAAKGAASRPQAS